MADRLIEHELSNAIIGGFYTVYNYFGFGLPERAYMTALDLELSARGYRVDREVHVPIHYHGQLVAWQRLDMVVDDRIIVEGKASEKLPPNISDRNRSYLKATKYEVLLLLHFGPAPSIHRYIDHPKKSPGAVLPDGREQLQRIHGPGAMSDQSNPSNP